MNEEKEQNFSPLGIVEGRFIIQLTSGFDGEVPDGEAPPLASTSVQGESAGAVIYMFLVEFVTVL